MSLQEIQVKKEDDDDDERMMEEKEYPVLRTDLVRPAADFLHPEAVFDTRRAKVR